MAYTYACSDYPGMAPCPGRFIAESQDELWEHIELHALVVHGEDPTEWSNEDTATIKALITND